MKLAVSFEECRLSAVREELAVFNSSKLAVGYKAAIMKCIGMVKQATANGLLHSSFLPKSLDKKTTDFVNITAESETVSDQPACDASVSASSMAENVNQLSVVNDNLQLNVADKAKFVKDEISGPNKTIEEEKVPTVVTVSPSSEFFTDFNSVQDTDIKDRCNFLRAESASSVTDTVSHNCSIANEPVDVSKIATIMAACHSSDDSNGADTVLKSRKTVRISEFPPEVSYFRHSNIEMAHKRKHADVMSTKV